METKNKIITIRENLIRDIEERDSNMFDVANMCMLSYQTLKAYFQGVEEALNGAEIQRIFDYLNGLK